MGDTGGADQPEVFFHSVEQAEGPAALAGNGRTVVARTSADASVLVRDMQRELLAIDPSLPVFSAITMARQIEQKLAGPIAVAWSLGLLGALGLALAGIGLYAVMAFAVARRSREIGIRIALGANARRVVALMLKRTMRPVVIGAVIGVAAAIGVSRILSSVLFGVSPADPVALLGAVLVVAGVAFAAGTLPARRAARVDPSTTLHYE